MGQAPLEEDSMMVWLLLASFVLSITVIFLDKSSIPAWKSKQAYRLVAFGLWLLLMGVVWKATLWHQELVLLIRGCR